MSIVETQEQVEDDLEFASLDEDLNEEVEVEETPEELEETLQQELPSKFKDKSVDDIVKSYTELEREFGRRNNEVGELRQLTDELLRLQVSEKNKEESEPEYELNVDTLLDNPNEAISKAVENHPKFKQFEEAQRTEATNKAKASFVGKHPDYQDLVSSEDFATWVQESPVRTKMFNEANQNYDFETGDELFTTYKALRGVANSNAEEEKQGKAKQALKKGSVERGSGQSTSKKVYRRADLINLKLSNPSKYAAMEPEIMKAYADKRVR
tara:strand:- start:551 stop:1357 length:807 start_codon:yes stop_codon:yes gene_type:complete